MEQALAAGSVPVTAAASAAEKDLAWAIAFDAQGEKVRELRGWGVGYKSVTAARRSGETLYLGSLTEHAIAEVELGSLSA